MTFSIKDIISSTEFEVGSSKLTKRPFETDVSTVEASVVNTSIIGTDHSYKHKIVWKNAIGFFILHILGLWGFYLLVTGAVCFNTILWTVFVTFWILQGNTIDAHRVFTHKSFEAPLWMKTLFLLLQTLSGENSIFTWCRDHRLHNRYTDTDGDPHNAKRGFFFSHIGWRMTNRNPYVTELGRSIDMSDLQDDNMVMFQKKYYYYLYFILAIFIPVWVPVYFFGESWWTSFLVSYALRYIVTLNGIWLVNSAAYLYNSRPYDKIVFNITLYFKDYNDKCSLMYDCLNREF